MRWFTISMATAVAGFASVIATKDAAADEKKAELDIVVTTNLQTGPEHVTKYLDDLRRELRGVFRSLDARVLTTGEAPADGAARFRIFAEHQGKVSIADKPLVDRGPTLLDFKLVGSTAVSTYAKNSHTTTWWIQTEQQGVLSLRLVEWVKGEYKPVATWTVPIPGDTSLSGPMRGRVRVADVVQETSSGRPDTWLPMPISLEEARKKSLARILQGAVGPLIHTVLAPGQLVRVESKAESGVFARDASAAVEVSIRNPTPWPVTGLHFTASWVDRTAGKVGLPVNRAFEPPLMPRQTMRVVAGTPDVMADAAAGKGARPAKSKFGRSATLSATAYEEQPFTVREIVFSPAPAEQKKK